MQLRCDAGAPLRRWRSAPCTARQAGTARLPQAARHRRRCGASRMAHLKPMSHQARAVRAPTQGSRLNSRRERLPTAPARASPREVRICSFALRAAGGGERRSGASRPRTQA